MLCVRNTLFVYRCYGTVLVTATEVQVAARLGHT